MGFRNGSGVQSEGFVKTGFRWNGMTHPLPPNLPEHQAVICLKQTLVNQGRLEGAVPARQHSSLMVASWLAFQTLVAVTGPIYPT